jgi:hypothetical protein
MQFAIAQLEFHQRAAEHLEEIMPLLDKEMGKDICQRRMMGY